VGQANSFLPQARVLVWVQATDSKSGQPVLVEPLQPVWVQAEL
jgi:hypothetical protein